MKTLHFVRHGESTWNVEGRLQGQTPHPTLTPRGVEQAGQAAQRLRTVLGEGATIWSSDLARARQTAEIILSTLISPLGATDFNRAVEFNRAADEAAGVLTAARRTIRLTPALREQALGTLEGKLAHELVPEPVPDGRDISEIRWGGGESVEDVHARLRSFIGGLPDGEHVLVSHGDTIRVALAVVEGRGHRDVDWCEVSNGAVITRVLA